MAEKLSRTIKWVDLFNPSTLQSFATDLKYFVIENVDIDEEFQQTTIEGTKQYSRQDSGMTWELISKCRNTDGTTQIRIAPDNSIEFFLMKSFNLSNFPQILRFVTNYCPYICDFIQDQNIQTIDISIFKSVRYSNDLNIVTDRINDFTLIRNWLNHEHNDELTPLILASLVQKFYQQNSTTFSIKSTSSLSRIKNNLYHVNSLLNNNIDLLKTYKLKLELDPCVKDGRKFEFLGNLIFQTNNFNMYDQNLDIKFLSYINCADLREKALNAESKPKTVEFGQNYQKMLQDREQL
jgi:hypothetical protein